MADAAPALPPVSFDTHPDRYRHWKLSVDGAVATLVLAVDIDGGLRPGYQLKLNTYDLSVDIELADAIRRLRFEHPQVRALVVTSGQDRVFSAGANIRMLAASAHGFKVNFCKFTNETRCEIEDMAAHSGVRSIAAVNGICAGGGYELALACDRIFLVDDGSSAVSLPEVPLLGVLPGTGGLTRLVDKRKIRRDHADLFCTKAEGYRLKDALPLRLVDGGWTRSQWHERVADQAAAMVAEAGGPGDERGVALPPLVRTWGKDDDVIELTYGGADDGYVRVRIDAAARVATLVVGGPKTTPPRDGAALRAVGVDAWAFAAFRQLDDALLELRFNHPTVGLLLLETEGDSQAVIAWDAAIAELRAAGDWFAREIQLFQGRTCRRLDNMARSMFALIQPGSCFAGSLLELALAADRSYMLDDPDRDNTVAVGPANAGPMPTWNGLTRLAVRFLGDPAAAAAALAVAEPIGPERAIELGLVTRAPDDLDWDDEVRMAIEERVSLSPDALTGMEQNLRFAGAETCETKVFGRLSAWQNWIFIRPNATGESGGLTRYGDPQAAVFDWRRT